MNTILTEAEGRVLGVLIEKQLSTPDHYPLTLNAATNACNQKSNRNPVVSFSESEVHDAVESLHRKHFAGRSVSTGSRTTKYRHSLGETMRLQRPELAVLASLLLRGPETLGEIRTRTSRMHEFETIEQVGEVVDALASREEPLVVHLPRQAGQKEARCAQLLCGEPNVSADAEPEASQPRRAPATSEIADLRDRVEKLEAAFHQFRKQFE